MTLDERQLTSNQRTKARAARRKHALAQAIAQAERYGETQKKLARLWQSQKGRCGVCGEKAPLDWNGGKSPDSAVRFRKGSGYGRKGRTRYAVMAHRRCADARSREIEENVPIEERWVRSGREPTEFYCAAEAGP